MKIIVRTLCVLIMAVLIFSTGNVHAQVIWLDQKLGDGSCPSGDTPVVCVRANFNEVAIYGHLGPGQILREVLFGVPRGVLSYAGSGGSFGSSFGWGSYASPIEGINFPLKARFVYEETFDGEDWISFRVTHPVIIPVPMGQSLESFGSLPDPRPDPDPYPWQAMALIEENGEFGWVGATMVPIPEPSTGYITGALLAAMAFWRRKCRHQNIWRLRQIKSQEGKGLLMPQ
jgi:hypothetical protein